MAPGFLERLFNPNASIATQAQAQATPPMQFPTVVRLDGAELLLRLMDSADFIWADAFAVDIRHGFVGANSAPAGPFAPAHPGDGL